MKNPFDHKSVEKALLATFNTGPRKGRRTRTFLRKQARNIEKAYQIGFKDAQAGKPLITLAELQDPGASPMGRTLYRWAYTAYSAGHRAGIQEKG